MVSILAAAGWIAASHAGIDPRGKPLGADFISFWTASALIWSGHPAAVYNVAIHHTAEIALFGATAAANYTAFFYPPVFMLVCLLLALLPYFPSLVAWLGLTGFAYWRSLRAILPQPAMRIAVLAFPAVLINSANGQNGFLTAALFAVAASSLPVRPVLAGICLGCLIYKPQLAVMVPLALLAARRWQTLFAAMATVMALLATSFLVFGLPTWQAFLATAPQERMVLERNLVGPEKMASTFAAVRLLHGGIAAAYAIQMLVSMGAMIALRVVLRRRPGTVADGALLAASALIASPFLLDYDLAILSLSLAWVMSRALSTGFLPWEKTTPAMGFVLPLMCRSAAYAIGGPLGPPVLFTVFAIVLRRVNNLPVTPDTDVAVTRALACLHCSVLAT